MHRRTIHAPVLVSCLLAGASSALAGEIRLESVGARGGFYFNRQHDSFYQIEAYADWKLPWCWSIGTNWSMRPRLDVSAGRLSVRDDPVFVGSAGANLVLSQQKFPLSLVGGVSPTVLSEAQIGGKDYGMPFQFTSYAGLSLQLGSRVEVGYRFQHMSNASLADHNPGLNLHSFGLGYRF